MHTNVMLLTFKSTKKTNKYILKMGLNNSKTTNALYLFQGTILSSGTKESHDLEKNGKFYHTANSVSGKITNIKLVDGYEGSKDLAVTINDLDEDYTLYFGVNSTYFKSFARSVPNIDFMSTIELAPTYKVENEVKKVSLVMKQNDVWIKRFYKADNMGDMPSALPVEVNGRVEYDYTAQNNFLLAELFAKFEEQKMPF